MTPEFYRILKQHFPGTLSLEDYMKQTYEVLHKYGFEDENTMDSLENSSGSGRGTP